jgi:hypothetical protein
MDYSTSIMSLVKVWTEIDGRGKCYSLPAKIVSKKGNIFTIKYLSVTDRKTREGKKIYTYESETYEITDDSITEYLETDSELDLGFENIYSPNEEEYDDEEGCFIKYESDSDDDYTPPSEIGDSSSSSETLSDDDEYSNDDDDEFSNGVGTSDYDE